MCVCVGFRACVCCGRGQLPATASVRDVRASIILGFDSDLVVSWDSQKLEECVIVEHSSKSVRFNLE